MEVCAFRVTGVLQTSVVVTLSTMDMSAQGKQEFNIFCSGGYAPKLLFPINRNGYTCAL